MGDYKRIATELNEILDAAVYMEMDFYFFRKTQYWKWKKML